MAWKPTGSPIVRKQRDKWVVRVDGVDTATGKHKPKQLGTYKSQRSALKAAREMKVEGVVADKGTVSWLVRRYVAGRTDITPKAQEQYAWAIPHIEAGLGAIQLSMLDRDDVAGWIEALAAGGKLSKRSVQICRTVLRAALTEAVDEGLISRSPAARVGLPRTVAKPVREKETETWTADEVDRFLEATANHRWAVAFRVSVLYGLRRSEMLALKWKNLDVEAGTLKIDESIVATRTGAEWSNAKNDRSRRTIPIDEETMRAFARRRAEQAAERLVAGEEWEDSDLIVATRVGRLVLPRSYDRALERFVESAEMPRLTSHGLRHTAATHMVQQASDLGELRAIADILGHSPEMLMNTYAHALPNSQLAVVDRIGRSRQSSRG
jgi:integrase